MHVIFSVTGYAYDGDLLDTCSYAYNCSKLNSLTKISIELYDDANTVIITIQNMIVFFQVPNACLQVWGQPLRLRNVELIFYD